MTKFILMDIEGTTSSISFVHETLFPYAKEKMLDFIRLNKEVPEVQDILTKLCAEQASGLSLPAAAELFNKWIDEDKKHGLLKKIQGLIWKEGFESGELKGHLYPEVASVLKDWKGQGIKLGIPVFNTILQKKPITFPTEFAGLFELDDIKLKYFDGYLEAGTTPKFIPPTEESMW